ncbi:MAG: TIGR00730 family Rossman fold protein [Chloroflexales bacterium]|nr:TIGR00730 family Rossman fold protein [Chloroflexales bacterium]
MAFNVCVYCGARPGRGASDMAAAHALGAALADQGWGLVYGGGRVGLMGAVAAGVKGGGGTIIGVIPEGLLRREQGDDQGGELVITGTLRERKAIMDTRADAFVALPGGFGTLEELVETMTLRQLGYHHKPIIIFNLDGYYDPLLAFFGHAIASGFVRADERTVYQVAATVDEVVAALSIQDAELSKNAIR